MADENTRDDERLEETDLIYLRGVYERHLLRTLAVRDGPAILKVLPERTVGE